MKSTDLFDLIRTMTPGEKRDFKKKSLTGREGANPNYLDLFGIIDGMSKYDESAVKAHLRNPVYAKNLSFGKNYLYHQLLESLRGLYAHAKPYPNPQIVVADYWARVHIFLGKNLISQMYKTIRQAKKHCAIYHLDADALKFRMLERIHISRREKKGAVEKLEKLRLECKKLQRDLDMELQIMERYEHLFVQIRYENTRKMKEAMAESVAFFEQHKAYFSEDPSFNCLVYYYFLRALECQVLDDRLGAANYYWELVELYEKDTRVKMANQERYLTLLSNYFSFRRLGTENFSIHEFKTMLARLQTLKGKDPKINFLLDQQGYHYQLLYFLKIGDYPQIMKLEAPITELLDVHAKKLTFDRRLIYIYHLALANFMMGLHDREHKERWLKKTIDWLNRIENMSRIDTRSFVRSVTKTLLVLTFFELGEEEHAIHRVRSLVHILKEQKRTGTIEYVVTQSLKKVLSTKTREKRREILEELDEKLIPFPDSQQIREWVRQKVKDYE